MLCNLRPAGLLEGHKGFNWVLLLRFLLGWVATLVVAGLTSGEPRRWAGLAHYVGTAELDVAAASLSLLPYFL
jgi:hypothetical protein